MNKGIILLAAIGGGILAAVGTAYVILRNATEIFRLVQEDGLNSENIINSLQNEKQTLVDRVKARYEEKIRNSILETKMEIKNMRDEVSERIISETVRNIIDEEKIANEIDNVCEKYKEDLRISHVINDDMAEAERERKVDEALAEKRVHEAQKEAAFAGEG